MKSMKHMKKLVAFLVVSVALSCGWVGLALADELGSMQVGDVSLNGTSYGWWYGCTPTSAGMMMGYYDRNGYGGLSYSNLVPGGVAEASTVHNDPLWDALVKPVIASQGYVNDYYSGDNNCGNNAYNVQHDDVASARAANCLADYMGSGQDWAGNKDGWTTIYYWETGAKYTAADAVAAGLMVNRNGVNESKDGMLGMDLYFRSCGYGTGLIANDTNFYTWHIKMGPDSYPLGCTFADYQALIDAGLVVMIQLNGHSMLGYGYIDNGGQQLIIFDDTWGDHGLTMTWGTEYDGMDQWGITVFDPTGGTAVPLPPSLLLMISGLAGLVGFRLRK